MSQAPFIQDYSYLLLDREPMYVDSSVFKRRELERTKNILETLQERGNVTTSPGVLELLKAEMRFFRDLKKGKQRKKLGRNRESTSRNHSRRPKITKLSPERTRNKEKHFPKKQFLSEQGRQGETIYKRLTRLLEEGMREQPYVTIERNLEREIEETTRNTSLREENIQLIKYAISQGEGTGIFTAHRDLMETYWSIIETGDQRHFIADALNGKIRSFNPQR